MAFEEISEALEGISKVRKAFEAVKDFSKEEFNDSFGSLGSLYMVWRPFNRLMKAFENDKGIEESKGSLWGS